MVVAIDWPIARGDRHARLVSSRTDLMQWPAQETTRQRLTFIEGESRTLLRHLGARGSEIRMLKHSAGAAGRACRRCCATARGLSDRQMGFRLGLLSGLLSNHYKCAVGRVARELF